MTDWRSTLSNAGWLISDRVIRLALNFVTGILIARELGPSEFGLLNYGQALIFLVTPLATAGLPEIVVRELSRSSTINSVSEQQSVIANALAIRAVSAILAIAVMFGLAFFASSNDLTAKFIIILYSLSIAPQALDVIDSALQAKGLFKIASIARTLISLLFSTIKILLIVFDAEVIWFAALFTIESTFFGVFFIIIAKIHDLIPGLSYVSRKKIKQLLSSSFLVMLRLFAIAVYMRIDQLMINYMLGSKALGIYSVATRISELWYFVPTAIMAAALPRLTQSHEGGVEHYERELRRWLRMMVAIALPVALTLSLLSSLIVDLLFGPDYVEAATVLAIQTWAGIFVAMGVASNPWFINTGLLRFGLYQTLAGAVISIGLNLLLIPEYGLIGASLSVIASQAISAFLFNAVFRETRPLFFLQTKALILR